MIPSLNQIINERPIQSTIWRVGESNYIKRVLSLSHGNLLAYWPLNDPLGSTSVQDVSGLGNHCPCSGNIVFQHRGIGDGLGSAYFDGTGYIDIYNALSSFDPTNFSLLIWYRAGVSTSTRRAITISTDANNRISFGISYNPTYENVYNYAYLAPSKNVSTSVWTSPDWVSGIMTVKDNRFDCIHVPYAKIDGHAGFYTSAVGTWSGALNSTLCVIGAASTALVSPMVGWIAHVALWNRAIPFGELIQLSSSFLVT